MRVVWLILFWLAAVGIAYTYVGYALLIAVWARWRPRPTITAPITPSLTVLVAAYDEEDCIARKIEDTLAQDYPTQQLELVVVADGSTDGTCEIVKRYAAERPNILCLFEPERRGKVGALIRAFPLTHGEIVVFSDANSYFAPGALRYLARHFADPQVGGASGAKRMLRQGDAGAEQGEGLYWRYEAWLKRNDSAVSSVMGVPGEIWAARRTAYVPPEPDTLLDDFVASLRMVAAGWRVVYDPEVYASEEASPSLSAEFARRSRNAAGGWQAFFKLRPLLRHPERRVTFQYISHRMLRWIVTPGLFVILLVANLALLATPFYRVTLALQDLFYVAALLGWWLTTQGRHVSILVAPFYICLLNAAALVGGWRFLRGTQSVVWRKVR